MVNSSDEDHPVGTWKCLVGIYQPRLRNIPLIARLVLTTKEERLWECYVSCHDEAMTASPGTSRNFKWATLRPPLLFAKPSAYSRKNAPKVPRPSASTQVNRHSASTPLTKQPSR